MAKLLLPGSGCANPRHFRNAALDLCLHKLDALGDHVSTCTAHSGAKKAHDWAVEQLADLFRTTHQVKTQQVTRSRRKRCGDIELAGYLADASGPVHMVLDLHITHERWGIRE